MSIVTEKYHHKICISLIFLKAKNVPMLAKSDTENIACVQAKSEDSYVKIFCYAKISFHLTEKSSEMSQRKSTDNIRKKTVSLQ